MWVDIGQFVKHWLKKIISVLRKTETLREDSRLLYKYWSLTKLFFKYLFMKLVIRFNDAIFRTIYFMQTECTLVKHNIK